MGIYLNPGNENFTEITKKANYVDKTMMIKEINRIMEEINKYICFSRPRRFGKTMAVNMLVAYYSKGCDSRELFAPFKIAGDDSFEEKLNKYNLIQIDMNSEYQSVDDKETLVEQITRSIKSELRDEFPDVEFNENDSLARCIQNIYAKKHSKFIIIIDEYDIIVREKVSQTLFDKYLSFLNGLFKSNTVSPAIELAYITGILPVVKDKVQSKLNNFEEFTMIEAQDLAGYVGFTEEDVKKLCNRHGMNYEECKRWYDGYKLDGINIYNPESVIKSMIRHKYGSYWGKTSTYEAISEPIRLNFNGMRDDVIAMIAGERVSINITGYMNKMDSFHTRSDVFTYLIHLGYLAYDEEEESCYIPNGEVRREWYNAVASNDDYKITNGIIEASKTLLEDTLTGNEEAVAQALNKSHIHVTSNRSYNNEDALQSAIYLAYIYALNKYSIFREMTAGKGFADVVFLPYVPDLPAMIIELKKNKTPESAIDQIRNKEYFAELAHYQGNMLFVGINYDEDKKTHSCKIERFVKEGYYVDK